MLTASEIMSEGVVVIYEDMLISQVAHLMLRDRVSSFPVVSKGMGIVGIITMTDLFMMISKAFYYEKVESFDRQIGRFKEMTVEKVMTRSVITISPQTTLDEIVNLVVKKGVHAFPVVEQDKLIGIVGRHDILNAIFSY